MTKTIELTRGQVAIVDERDYEELSKYRWLAEMNRGKFVAVRKEGPPNNRRTIPMSRMVIDVPLGMLPDHINGNGLDNRRNNLRPCTHQENCCNRGKRRGGLSRFKGVSKDRNRWRAQIMACGKRQYLGLYDTEEIAAQEYDKAALRLHSEFARTNVDIWGEYA